MPNLISTVIAAGLQGENTRTYLNVLEGESALMAITGSTGGMIMPNVDFRDHKIPVTSDSTLPQTTAEAADKPVQDATIGIVNLSVEMRAKFRQISRQMELNQDPDDLAASIVKSAVPGFPIAFDVAGLSPIVGGASITTVEFDAANAIASLSAWIAPYDETPYGASGMILTRRGARVLGLSVDGNGKLQAPAGVQSVLDLPSFVTKATGTQLGNANLLGVIGPWEAGHAATALGVEVERMPQATINGVGPRQNMVNYRIEGADGYANAVDAVADGTGFTILIDAV